MPILQFVCGGAPPTKDVHRVIPMLTAAGWDVWVVPTPQGRDFLDVARVEAVTGHPLRSEFRSPDEEKLPMPRAVLAAPVTFNTVNKWAAGIADTFALGLLTEAIGEGRPVVVVPWAKVALTSHPAFDRSVRLLRSLGVCVVESREGSPIVRDAEVPDFPWGGALASLPSGTADDHRRV